MVNKRVGKSESGAAMASKRKRNGKDLLLSVHAWD
jgi:hypothetical protein